MLISPVSKTAWMLSIPFVQQQKTHAYQIFVLFIFRMVLIWKHSIRTPINMFGIFFWSHFSFKFSIHIYFTIIYCIIIIDWIWNMVSALLFTQPIYHTPNRMKCLFNRNSITHWIIITIEIKYHFCYCNFILLRDIFFTHKYSLLHTPHIYVYIHIIHIQTYINLLSSGMCMNLKKKSHT